ncbi:acetoin utilization protein AcuC [Rhodobacteraceae bacterium CCMM004]|nr:acetoin utilization protein AcuC [Rhodobacteraceae bacterium CCMM004]
MGFGHAADVARGDVSDRGAPRLSPGAAPRFIGSTIYRGSSYGPRHPLRVPRVPTVMDLTRALGWLGPAQYLTSPRARPAALAAWHTPGYLAALERAEAQGRVSAEVRARHGLGTLSNPVYGEMFRRPATAAGASIMAGQLLRDPGVIHSPGGGTHHGLPDRANGFCYLNDPVLAILSLRAAGVRRVAYVDIDAHHCDGVEHAFARDTDVLMVSVHEERRWPFTGALEDRGAGTVWNLPVPRGFNDTEFQAVLEGLILPRLQDFAPEALVLQCGADALLEDPLSRLALSNNAHWAAVAALRPVARRLLVLGGGGYNPWSVGRCWTGVWAVLNGIEIPDRLPPQGAAVLRDLRWEGHSRGRNPPEVWFTTLRDPPRPGPVSDAVLTRLATLTQRALVWV